jgi:hypothetical protein
MSDYNILSAKDINSIESQIDEGMRTTNGDTAPVSITARQAAILLWSYAYSRRPTPEEDVFPQLPKISN